MDMDLKGPNGLKRLKGRAPMMLKVLSVPPTVQVEEFLGGTLILYLLEYFNSIEPIRDVMYLYRR